MEVSRNFKKNDYLEGLILDIIADQIIYNLTDQLYEKIYEYAKNMGMGLTRRMSPGDKDVPIEMQKEILLSVQKDKKIDVILQMDIC